VLFPEFARFGMTLEPMEDWEDETAVQLLLEAVFIPVCIGVVNGYKGGSLEWRRVCISILGIASIDSIVLSCGESKEKLLCGLFNTGRIC